MDKKCDKKTRSASQSLRCKRGREDPRREAEKSRAFKESKNEKESTTGRNFEENAQKVKSMYAPVKEQLQVLVEYINILEKKPLDDDCIFEISFIFDFLNNIKRYCEIYLSFNAIKIGKNNGNSSLRKS